MLGLRSCHLAVQQTVAAHHYTPNRGTTNKGSHADSSISKPVQVAPLVKTCILEETGLRQVSDWVLGKHQEGKREAVVFSVMKMT